MTSRFARGLALAGATAVLFFLFSVAGFPAGAVLAAMIAAILVGRGLKLPRLAFLAAQGVVGCMIGQAMTPELFADFISQWPLVLVSVTCIIVLSAGLGWLLHARGPLDKATALWGTLPGAASAVLAQAAEQGANVRIVTFVQYFRVVTVAILVTLLSVLLIPASGETTLPAAVAPPSLFGLAACLAIVAALALAASRVRIVGLCLVGAMLLTATVPLVGMAEVWLPAWLLSAGYVIIGWHVGLALNPDGQVPIGAIWLPVVLNTAVLLLACCGIAWGLSSVFSVDFNTAYLATVPGGLDSVAVIAAATGADVAFVMLFQTTRLFIVVLIGIPLLGHILRCRPEDRPEPSL